jgi:hypothetical protein
MPAEQLATDLGDLPTDEVLSLSPLPFFCRGLTVVGSSAAMAPGPPPRIPDTDLVYRGRRRGRGLTDNRVAP